MTTMTAQEQALIHPYAFALLQWPATLALLGLDSGGWWLALKIAAGIWLALMVLASYAGKRPGRIVFGNAMLVSNLSIAGAWWTHPGGWMLAFATITLLLLYTAQRALLRPEPDTTSADGG